MKISTTTGLHSVRPGKSRFSLLESIEFLIDAGFQSLDINFNNPSLLEEDWKYKIASAVELASKRGVAFSYSHVPFNYPSIPSEENWCIFNQSVLRAIEASAFAGANWAVIHPNTSAVTDFDWEKAKKATISHLLPFTEKAAAVGIGLAVENMRGPHVGESTHRYCSTTTEVCDLVDSLGGNIGICWDFGHAQIAGLDQPKALAKVGKRLKVLHVNDNFGLGDDHLAPFTGTVNWPAAMEALKSIGFTGEFNYEVSSGRIPECARSAFVKYLIETAHYLITL